MIDILWVVVCLIIAVPLIVNPNKIVERPNCKIKSPMTVRILGILIAVLGMVQLFI